MNKKRKLKVFPIISLAVFLFVVIFAVVLIVKTFSDKNENTPEENNTNIEENVPDLPEITDLPINDEKEEETPVFKEDDTVFNEDAPKPVYTQKELVELFPDTVLTETEDAGQSYINDMVFIGDSTTHGMAFYGVLEGGKETTQVWTPKSGTLAMWNLLTEKIVYPDDDSEMLIGDAIAVKQPKIVVLTLGVNGVSSLEKEDFKGYYSDLIKEIKNNSLETKIILQSIYPVCDYYEMKSISMEKINRANTWIAELASEEDVYYLNTISALVNEKGHLTDSYCNGDGIHISKEGFGVILDYIRTHKISE